MTDAQFQKLVLQKLAQLEKGQTKLEKGQTETNGRLTKLEKGQTETNGRLTKLEKGQTEASCKLTKLEDKLDERSAEILAEVRQSGAYINQGFDRLSDQMRETADLRERVALLEQKVAAISR